MNKFLQEFHDRGYFYQCTDDDGLSKILDDKKILKHIIVKKIITRNYKNTSINYN